MTETDARLGVSVCTGTSDVSLVSGYDFSNWLPLPSVVDSLVLDFPDSKFLLFETPVEQWLSRIKLKAAQARTLGVKCGCVSAAVGGAAPVSRSTSSACGDATHHTCDGRVPVFVGKDVFHVRVRRQRVERGVRESHRQGQGGCAE